MPKLLIDGLLHHPISQLADETGASCAALQCNLARFAARGLAREVTGQGRDKIWAVKDLSRVRDQGFSAAGRVAGSHLWLYGLVRLRGP